MCDMPSAKQSAESKRREMEMRDEDDHRQITRAEEIRGDPKRMAGVLRHHRKQSRAVARMGRSLGMARGGARG